MLSVQAGSRGCVTVSPEIHQGVPSMCTQVDAPSFVGTGFAPYYSPYMHLHNTKHALSHMNSEKSCYRNFILDLLLYELGYYSHRATLMTSAKQQK